MCTKLNKVPGILLAIDFEKALDSLRWDFLDKCLQTFNYGHNFRSYINVLYCEISAAVLNNEHISCWFAPERGVRQGCPLSPYLFILAVETHCIYNLIISHKLSDHMHGTVSCLLIGKKCL